MNKKTIYAAMLLIVATFALVFLAGLEEERILSDSECREDSDCIETGCSGQICSSEEMASSCEWKDEYACLNLTTCSCIKGKCDWEETMEYRSCIGRVK